MMTSQKDDQHVDVWFDKTPGLAYQAEFMAWANRATSPIIVATAKNFTAPCSLMVVERAVWDTDSVEETGLADPGIINAARAHFSGKFGNHKGMLVFRGVDAATSGDPSHSLVVIEYSNLIKTVHKTIFSTLSANEYAAERVRRDLEAKAEKNKKFVRLCGLKTASGLNGREGELLNEPPREDLRFPIVIDGSIIRAKSSNFKPVYRPKLFVNEF